MSGGFPGCQILKLNVISKVIGTGQTAVAALRAVGLYMDAGEFAAAMGRSGSGNSSLANHRVTTLDRDVVGTAVGPCALA
ncbi:hypothetical protein [Paeniglutamicibacter cryotolerans]|uniref:ABC-type lipoprotein export system ATPase subunit n=1 Tax=Paeniglutamicibacter cryotolerans TaxID=670079 RepID=A0A839QDC0_9MICC|nr:hypothetical protein [Paeniglutamicibacter cryotolerans]MBB2994139.1 ABC-type lipoprotein export system ATPase subunit [Paeniglutamicibacter cryotolerans]